MVLLGRGQRKPLNCLALSPFEEAGPEPQSASAFGRNSFGRSADQQLGGWRYVHTSPPQRDFWRFSHLGIQFVIIIMVFALGGARLDDRLSAGGLVTLAGVFVGATIGFYVIYREISRK